MANAVNVNVFKKSGKFTLTQHAKDRIRQRTGIEANDAKIAWVNEQIAKSHETIEQGNKTIFQTEHFEIVCDGLRVVTVKPREQQKSYVEAINEMITKQITNLLAPKERLFRKAEIKVAELTLNFLKARNPNTKSLINERLVAATDERQRIAYDIKALKLAAEKYGVSAEV